MSNQRTVADLYRSPVFNTPVESALRSLFILNAISPNSCDLDRMVIYDYLLVHSGDINDSNFVPVSLHPPTPFRSGELLVRRKLIIRGLRLLLGKKLIVKEFRYEGFVYKSSDLSSTFLNYLQDPYSARCREISSWIERRFHTLPNDELRRFIFENIGRWGAEFSGESSLWGNIE